MTVPAALERLTQAPQRFPGALLLSGPSQGALDAAARRLAAGLLCPGGDPDRRCDSCRRVFAGLHPDLFRAEPEGVQIRVDRIREALAFGAGRPYESARRVILVPRADMLGLEAANALLKSLEEPGAHLHWILTTTRPEALLATIRSRCAAAALARPSTADRAALWRERGFSAEEATDLAQLATGQDEAAPDPAALSALRLKIGAALEAGLVEASLPALLLLAEVASGREDAAARILTGLLADAALVSRGAGDFVRHRALSAKLSRIARRVDGEALRRAALRAAEPPPDSRRGNRRLHFEALLIELFLESR
jgi:hypothetical protein